MRGDFDFVWLLLFTHLFPLHRLEVFVFLECGLFLGRGTVCEFVLLNQQILRVSNEPGQNLGAIQWIGDKLTHEPVIKKIWGVICRCF